LAVKPYPPEDKAAPLASTKPVSTPLFPIAFDKKTPGALPVNIPLPPRSKVVASPLTSKLKPTILKAFEILALYLY
jgi:hypothetical protein